MPVNIEIKARVNDPARTRSLAEALADKPSELLRQTDTFFRVPSGRLKLREFRAAGPGARAELIFYRRPDGDSPKPSNYAIHRTDDPDGLRSLLAMSLGELGCVRKERMLLMAGRTRIHLDEVEGLGSYLELEVVLEEGEDHAIGQVEAERLMAALEIGQDALVDVAYIDLLTAASG